MAEALLATKTTVDVDSKGLMAREGADMSEGTKQVLAANGIAFDKQASNLTETDVKAADLILTMTRQHKRMIQQQFPAAIDKTDTLKAYSYDAFEDEWQALKDAYLVFEEKHQQQVSGEDVPLAELAASYQAIETLEARLPSPDIPDPFGGNAAVYLETFQTIEAAIDQLVKRLNLTKK